MTTTDANGVVFYETTDPVSPLQTLLNLGQTSVSNALNARSRIYKSVAASPPASPVAGDFWYQTDSGALLFYTASWAVIGPNQPPGNAIRASDQTVSPGVTGDLSGVISGYGVRAGVSYTVMGTGCCLSGGANGEVTTRISMVPAIGSTVLGPALVHTGAVNIKTPVSNQLVFTAANTTTITVKMTGVVNSPSTGLILYTGSSVSVGVSG